MDIGHKVKYRCFLTQLIMFAHKARDLKEANVRIASDDSVFNNIPSRFKPRDS